RQPRADPRWRHRAGLLLRRGGPVELADLGRPRRFAVERDGPGAPPVPDVGVVPSGSTGPDGGRQGRMITFHRFLIATAILFCGGFALWSIVAYRADGGLLPLALGVTFALAAG